MSRIIAYCMVMMACSISFASNLHFASAPSLTPDGSVIYFSYGGDIYKVDSNGGLALMVVSIGGNEGSPKVSPDGRFLAFSSNVQGNNNVYVVPVNGGEVRQLTFHDASDIPVSWSPDSRFVYFESSRYNSISTYKVHLEGGTPQRLFPDYFNTIANLVQNPVTGEFYFNESSESYRFATRKGYKGDHNPDIKSWNAKTREFKVLTQYRGKDIWPMVDVHGNLYYVSDQENGEANIVRHSDGRFITSFEESVQYPSISAQGGHIVFLKGYRIHLFDISAGEVVVPAIEVAKKPVVPDMRVDVKRPDAFAISMDGKKLAFAYRGMLFVSDAKGNFVTQLETPDNERVSNVVWASDSKTLYYTRTNRGWYSLCKQSADARGNETVVFAPDASVNSLTISNKGDKAAFVCGGKKLMILDMAADAVKELNGHEFWAFQDYRISFSYDDRFLAYTAVNIFERDVFIYDLAESRVINVTNSANTENDPVFGPGGKYLYMLSNRTSASFPRGAALQLYKVPLYKVAAPFKRAEYEKLFSDADSSKKNSGETIPFDLENLQRRYSAVVGRGSQGNPFVVSTGGKDYLLFNSSHEGESGLYVLEIKDWDATPPKRVKGAGAIYSYSFGGKVLMGADREGLYRIDPASASATKISVKHGFEKNIKDEFEQMFHEVWATLEQNFYDVDFHGVDWIAKRDYYASFLDKVETRDNLRVLLNDMLNELNSSHMGFSSIGEEEKTSASYVTKATGLMFREDSPYVLDRIVAGSPADFSANPLMAGDRLVSVNGFVANEKENREFYFTGASGLDEIALKFIRNGKELEVTIHSFPSSRLRSLLYTEWEDFNRARTEELSDGRIAYVHMRDMGDGALEQFLIDMNSYAVHKDALILDLRFNNGGNVHKEVIDFLAAREHFRWSHRDHPMVSHPNVIPSAKPLVVLINERSLSDAEVTSNGIKALSLAKLVGTETYRWIIFTSGTRLIDGSSVRLPAWGCYTLDGKDMEFEGVSPDIYVKNTFEDRVNSRDPQLERAIDEVLKELSQN
ncbi:MAG: S41 family peptidase [Bacteroidales bacterium]